MRAAEQDDVFYRTIFYYRDHDHLYSELEYNRAMDWFDRLTQEWNGQLMMGVQPNGYIFGCVAVRMGHSFMVSKRGKGNLGERTIVGLVDHSDHFVYCIGPKASLNAPLLDRIFDERADVSAIVHYHDNGVEKKELSVLPWAYPGTVKDTFRDFSNVEDRFYIEDHGMFVLIK